MKMDNADWFFVFAIIASVCVLIGKVLEAIN